MSLTFGQLKTAIRGRIWPPGSGEPDNLIASHDKSFIDGLVDLQTCVPCLQQDNTDIIPQCATTYNCGLTVLPAPRGIIKKLSVIDKIDPDTYLESATAADDYCSEIPYNEVDFCHVRRYLDRGKLYGPCCNSIGLYFGLPFTSYRPIYPTPTDEGVATDLPPLPMGYHYPQTSTDRTYGRAGAGVWAKERGNIFVAPWIQSTETIIVLWDGIKRIWSEADMVDDDPLLSKALEEYVLWQHEEKWGNDYEAAQAAAQAYALSLRMLIHQCREETRVRNCEPSHARAVATLYYNDEQSYTASCPNGTTGDSVSITIAAGTIGSSVSVADANQKAVTQARAQAEAQLECTQLYWNTIAYTKSSVGCAIIDSTAPAPQCTPVTVTVGVGTVSSTVSTEDANTLAEAKAQTDADAGQTCEYFNSPQYYDTACPDGSNPVTGSVTAGQYSSTVNGADSDDLSATQAAANTLAQNKAKNQANEALEAVGCTPVYWNLAKQSAASDTRNCGSVGYDVNLWISIIVDMPAHLFSSSIDQATANQIADDHAEQFLTEALLYFCTNGYAAGTYHLTYNTEQDYSETT
jgi:hypothetical protein